MTVQNMHNALTPGTAGEIFLYQDSRDAGSVYRFVVTLTMHIHKRYLEQAIEDLMPRFPSFSVGLERSGESLRLVPLENEVPVFECGCDLVSDGLPLIGGPELGGYLFRVSYSGKTLLFDWHLSLCDGKGMFEFVKAAVFRYMQISGYPVSNDGTVKEADDASNSIEGMGGYKVQIPGLNHGTVSVFVHLHSWHDNFIGKDMADCIGQDLEVQRIDDVRIRMS